MTHARALLLPAFILATTPALAAERFVGEAFAHDGNPLLYREVHLGDDTRHVVLYQCPDGKVFARKLLHVTSDPNQPDFAFVDGRTGYQYGVRRDGGKRVAYERDTGGNETTHVLPDEAGAVIDAGFDHYVRSHWDLMAKGDLSAPFLVTQRGRFYPVKLMVKDSAPGMRRIDMKLDAWYGFAVPVITVTYTDASRELRRYEGPGSIRNAKGKPIDVRIEFAPADRRDDAPPDSLDAALAAPLDGHCAS